MQAARRVEMIYKPRPLQAELHKGFKRFNVLVCHRRFGKTTTAVNQLIGSGLRAKKKFGGTRPHYAYVAPLRNQVKNIAWEPLKYFGSPFIIDANEAELRVDLLNGSRIQLFGADNPDAGRGLGLDGVVFDEFGDMDPTMWRRVFGPALSDRQGWAAFIGTPKGENHFKDIAEEAQRGDPSIWFYRMLKASQTGIIPEAELAQWRSQMSEEEYAQEFECSFVAPVSGAFYAKDIEKLRADKRIGKVPYEPGISVHTAWDLGIDDATCVWFFQLIGREIRIVDYIEDSGLGLDHYVNELRRKSYTFGQHILPHDVEVRELGTGRTRKETLNSLGLGQIVIAPAQPVADGINAVRQILPRCWFDEERTRLGVRALTAYRREYDAKRQAFKLTPLHDWSSHASDAFRILAMSLSRLGDKTPTALKQAATPIVYPKLGVV